MISFEFLNGAAPFTADTKEEIFKNIVQQQEIAWVEEMSAAAKDFILRLLEKNPERRLGAQGVAQIKAHPFFAGIDWENQRQKKACFVPRLKNKTDTKYFAKEKKNFSLSALKAGERKDEEEKEEAAPAHCDPGTWALEC